MPDRAVRRRSPEETRGGAGTHRTGEHRFRRTKGEPFLDLRVLGGKAPQAGLPMPATAMAVTALTGRRSRVRTNLVVGAGVRILGCGALLFLGAGSPLWLLAPLAGVPRGLVGLHDLAALLPGVAAAFLPVCAADRSLDRVGTDPRRRP